MVVFRILGFGDVVKLVRFALGAKEILHLTYFTYH